MATKRSSSSSLMIMITIITITIELWSWKTSASNVEGNDNEIRLLLSFKASLNDPLHVLSDWTNDTTTNTTTTHCQWRGISCSNSSRVNSLQLASTNISGRISPLIFQLRSIETLDLSDNQLTGELPSDMFGNSHSLKYLNLSNNNLTGPVPLGSASTLETLDLSNNMLLGSIPADIGKFSSLKYIDLGGNALSGTVPISMSNLPGLEYLTLASNRLWGGIPRELCSIKTLKLIYFGYNNFSGEIPREIGELRSLRHLDLVYNNLSGPIPTSLGDLAELRYLFLYQNKLTGPVPQPVFELVNLVSLDLSDNSLSGEVPESVDRLQRLEILQLFSNNFTGKIPIGLASLPRLQVLQLWSNNFSGEIPRDLGRRNNLTVLDLSTNFLVGRIPPGLCDSGRLIKLILFSNSLEGEIPEGLSRCTSLSRVRVQNNGLFGELPAEFTKLPLVYFLDISGNEFSGRIGDSEWEMASLQMLNLGGNQFSGKLPDSFGSENLENLIASGNRFSGEIPPGLFRNTSKMVQLELSRNELSGEIPEELLSSCERLVSLDLSHNSFSGEIPQSLARMPVLGQLDLSDNDFFGEIPGQLGRFPSLVQVNVSYNRLHGSLPSTAAFLAINATAVAGNNGLCGGESGTGLPPCNDYENKSLITKNHRPTWWFVVTCLFAAGAALALLVFIIGVFVRRARPGFEVKIVENNHDGVWELQFFEPKLSKSITMKDIILASKQVISSNKVFTVKEIKDVNSVPSSVWSEIRELGKIRHRNLVRLIGLCRSQKGGYLVYDHVDGGKLLSEVLGSLSWERRRNIVVRVAKAMRFLHRSCSSGVGCLSPEEIVIDGDGEPRLSLRVPGMAYSGFKGFNSCAYVAPETMKGSTTEKSDIYGFGIITIELLTGKSPADAEFGVHETFVEWARYCYSECHLDMWIDPSIRGHVSNNQDEIVQTMNLALQCTAGDPTIRPCAADLSKTLTLVMRTTHKCASRF